MGAARLKAAKAEDCLQQREQKLISAWQAPSVWGTRD